MPALACALAFATASCILFYAQPSFLCVTETESMATVCPIPTAPQVAVAYTDPRAPISTLRHEGEAQGARVSRKELAGPAQTRLRAGSLKPCVTEWCVLHDPRKLGCAQGLSLCPLKPIAVYSM